MCAFCVGAGLQPCIAGQVRASVHPPPLVPGIGGRARPGGLLISLSLRRLPSPSPSSSPDPLNTPPPIALHICHPRPLVCWSKGARAPLGALAHRLDDLLDAALELLALRRLLGELEHLLAELLVGERPRDLAAELDARRVRHAADVAVVVAVGRRGRLGGRLVLLAHVASVSCF